MSVFDLSAHDLNRLPQPGEAGKWVGSDLQDVASDLRAGEGQSSRSGIRSVPDAWAQMLLARDALFEPGNTLHDETRGQWRALIATIALAPRYKQFYSLSVLPFADAKGRLTRLLLGTVMAPRTSMCDTVSWETDTAAIQLTDVRSRITSTIGLAVPDIVTAPGRAFPALRVAGVPWLADGPVDPTTVNISSIEASIIAGFCNNLAESARRLPVTANPSTTQVRQKLIDSVAAFANAAAAIGNGKWQTRAGGSSGLPWPRPLDAALVAPPEIVSDVAAGGSECAVKVRADIELPFRSIILADPALASADRPAHHIQLFDTWTLADAEVRLPEIKAIAARHGHLVLGPSDLLTANLVGHADGSTMPGHNEEAAKHFLPVTPTVLLILSGEALGAAAIVRPQGATIQAGIRLQMIDGTSHDLVRDYIGDRLKPAERLANFAMWPDFISPDWKHHVARASSNPAIDPCLVLAGAGRVIAADLTECSDDRRGDRVTQWSTLAVLDRNRQQDFGRGSAILTQFPLSDPSDGKQSSLQAWCSTTIEALFMTLNGEPAGCVVPKLKRLAAHIAVQRATVAIDFGTSNTIVRWARDGQVQGTPQLKSRVVQPIAAPSGGATFTDNARLDLVFFLPVIDQAMPFPTMILERSLPSGISADVDCAEQAIYFADRQGSGTISGLLGLLAGDTIKANIKWDSTAIGKLRATRFLRQLVMMIGAELATEGLPPSAIDWRLSYASAFEPVQQQKFRALIGEAIDRLTGTATASRTFHPEGLAAKQALALDGTIQSTSSLIVLLDIGGGTTDVAIWHGSQTLWQGSFRVAARSFFTEALVRHPSILDATGALDAAAANKLRDWSRDGNANGRDAGAARNLVELTIGQPDFDEKFRKAMRLNGQNQDWRALEIAATTAVSGMLWYLGRLLKRRLTDKEWEVPAVDLAAPTIALAGRGASYFRHLDPEGTIHLPAILGMLTRAMDFPDAVPNVYFSPTPKREVVDGLLSLSGQQPITSPSFSAAILGEKLSYQGTEWSADTDLAAVPMPDASPDISLSETRAFLAALKDSTGIAIDLTRPTSGGTLQGAVTTAMKSPFRYSGAAKPAAIETPLFILGLAALVDELVKL